MPKTKILLGSYVQLKKPLHYLQGVYKQMVDFQANTAMFFTGPPQSFKRIAISKMYLPQFLDLVKKNPKIELKNIFVHAPYLINLANLKSKSVLSNSFFLLEQEITRTLKMHLTTIILHPGCSLNYPRKQALDFLISNLDLILGKYPKIRIALETMAGKGSELGTTFEELAYILNNLQHKNQVGICIDTCHIYDAGYDIKDNLDQVLDHFQKIIGLDKLILIHLNDSKYGLNSHRDRHANVGCGHLKLKGLQAIVYHQKLIKIPKLLETPFINQKPIFKQEIKLLKNINND